MKLKIKVYNIPKEETILKKIWWFLKGATKVKGDIIKNLFNEIQSLEDDKIYYLIIN